MPIYEYACKQCGKLNEVIQKVTDPAPAQWANMLAEKENDSKSSAWWVM